MAAVRFVDVTKRYPDGTQAVDRLNLLVGDGQFMVLVGPSGCGKTTALRMVAGLEEISEGEILIADQVINGLEPRRRDIAMVFQNYALYPNMTVAENIAFGLKMRKVSRAERHRKVQAIAEILGLVDYLGKKPGALSGGQRQRVAMGRAIVREPKAFLMDEPLSNLDAKLRVSMRAELAKLHERLNVTTVYVTHDQVEAMTLGQRVAVLRDGVLQQVDTPQNLFHQPANLFVAAFIGSPSMNLIEAECGDGRIRFADMTIELPAGSPAAGRSGRLIVGIRPTDFEHSSAADPSWPRVHLVPDVVEDLGAEHHVIFTVDAPRVSAEAVRAASDERDDEGKLFADDRAVFTASVDDRERIPSGQRVELALNHKRLHFFEPETGERLAGSPVLASA